MQRNGVGSRGRTLDDDDDERGNAAAGGGDYSSRDTSDDERLDEYGDDSVSGAPSARERGAGRKAALEAAAKEVEITCERTVIHEALLRRAIHKELKTYYEPAVVPLESELELESQTRLVLSFCNIFAIDNLLGFEQLTHLQLDNNIIERIEHLDHLVNLKWLDLSFNKITKITGLEKLVKLTDLSLFDNEITVVEGLDTLVNLNVLSIGNNQIKDLSFVTGLRKFKNLRGLNLKGNPICQHDDYHNTIFAYLTNLKYLDYIPIERSQFEKARDTKLDQLLILEAKEKVDEANEKEKKQASEQQAILDQANLQGLSTLFVDMIKADAEHPKIRVLPGFDIIFNQYRTAFNGVIEEFSHDILQRHAFKQEEEKQCQAKLLEVNTKAESDSRTTIGAFHHAKKKKFEEYVTSLDRGHADPSILTSLSAELDAVYASLMETEMELVGRVENLLEQFEKGYMKLVGENLTRINTCFKTLIDTSSKHQTHVYDLTHHLLEKFVKDDTFTDEVDVKAILSDKDVLNTAVVQSHDNHDEKILKKEEEIFKREEGNAKRLLEQMHTTRLKRHTKRVAEIQEFKAREEAAIQEQHEQQDEEDDA